MMNRKKPMRPTSRPDAPKRPTRATGKPKVTPKLAEEAADDAFDGEAPEAEGGVPAPQLVRLNKFLADHGVASRRRCDELIAAGKVTVDDVPVNELGLKIDPDKQVVEINGIILKPKDARRRYYVLNKPSGVVCTNEPRETRPRAVDLITDPYKGRVYTVGRLDEESKGLIIITNDGEFANRIMHPRYGIEKTYVVRVRGRIEDDAIMKIREGVHLSEGRTAGARILVDRRTHDSSQLTVTVHEGVNREIRRVFARVGYKVTDLRRIRIGPLSDAGLKPGRWRELLNSEVVSLLDGKNVSQIGPRVSSTGPRKRFTKKSGYSREFVKGGKLVPGARREREMPMRIGDRPRKSFGDGPRAGGSRPGPRSGASYGGAKRSVGPSSGPRSDFGRPMGPRTSHSRPGSARPGAARPGAARPGAARSSGPRSGAPRQSGARMNGPRSGGAGGGGPRSGGPRSSGPRSGGPSGPRSDRGGRR